MPVIDLGKVVGDPGASMRFRGEWNGESEYFNNSSYVDTVTHHGSLWVCKQTNTGQEPIEGDYWGIGAYGTETGFDTTITIPATGWSGVSAPFAQTVTVSGMTYNKAIVYAVQSNNATPTDSEKAEYAKITGISQNTDSITFYADEKPTADIIIRAFNGAGSEDAADLSVIAAPFDTGEDYTEGRYCMYEGQMWRFDKAKPSGAWDSSKATSTTVADVLEAYEEKFKELNSRVEELETPVTLYAPDSPVSFPGEIDVDIAAYRVVCIVVYSGSAVTSQRQHVLVATSPKTAQYIPVQLGTTATYIRIEYAEGKLSLLSSGAPASVGPIYGIVK